MASFDEYRKKLNSKYGVTEEEDKEKEKEKSNTSQTGSTKNSSSFDTYRSKMESKYNPSSKVDQDYVSSFLSDAGNFLNSAESDYDNMYFDTSKSIHGSRLNTANDLRKRAFAIEQYLDENKGVIDEETLNSFKSYLDDFTKTESDLRYNFYQANQYYSNLGNMSSSEIKEKFLSDEKKNEIAYTTEDGRNITWQSLYDQKWAEEDLSTRYKDYSSRPDWETNSQGIDNVEDTRSDYDIIFQLSRTNMPYERELALKQGYDEADFDDIEKKRKYISEKYGVDLSDIYDNVNVFNDLMSQLEGKEGELDSFDHMPYMTEEEQQVLNYIYHTEGRAAALEWHNSRKSMYQQRSYDVNVANLTGLAKENPFGASLGSVALNIGAGAEYITDLFDYWATGEDQVNTLASSVSALRGGVSESVNWEIGNWDAFDFVYNTGMSMADSAASMLLFGKFGGVVQGLSAAASATDDALRRGMSTDKAFWNGLVAGVFEGLFETFSISQFKALKESATITVKDLAKNIGKSMLTNASEETLTEIANIAYDSIVNGDFSNYETTIRQYMNAGMSEEEAKLQASKDLALQVVESGASGALMGFGFGVLGGGASYIGNNVQISKHGQAIIDQGGTNALKQLALEMAGDTNSLNAKAIGKLANKVGNKASANSVGKLSVLMEDSVESRNIADIQKALQEKGLSKAEAKKVADVVYKSSQGYDLTEKESSLIDGKSDILDVIRDVEKIDSNQNKRVNDLEYARLGGDSIINKVIEGNSVAKTVAESETATGEKLKVSETGNTTYTDAKGDTWDATIKRIASTDGGLKVELEDGTTVKASDLSFSTTEEANMYEMIARMDVTPDTANELISTFKPKNAKNALQYLSFVPLTYQFGKIGYEEGLKYIKLSDAQKRIVYNRGKMDAMTEAKNKTSSVKKDTAKKSASTKKNGIIYENGYVYDESKANELQKTSMAYIDAIDKMSTSLEIHVFESHMKNGKRVATINGKEITANGFFQNGNQIYIDINAGAKGEGVMLYTMAHEITHFIRQWNAKDFKALADFLIAEYGKQGVNVNYLIEEQKKRIKKRYAEENKALPSEAKLFDMAYEELVADAMSDMLADEKAYEKLAKLKQKDRNLWKKLGEAIKAILDKLKGALGIYKDDKIRTTQEAYQVRNFSTEAYNKLQDLYLKAFVEAEANYEATIGSRNLNEFEAAKNENGEALFQYRAMEADEDTYRDMLQKWGKMSDAQVNNLFATIDTAMELIKDNLEILDYAWEADIDDRAFSPVKPNSDKLYQVSLDFSTLCRKRILQQTVQAQLQEALNKPLTREEGIAIRDALMALQEEGRQIEVACALCYVESARMKSPEQIKRFVENKEKVIKEFFAGKSGGNIKEKIKQAEIDAREKLHKENPNGILGKDGKTKLDPRDASLKALPKKYADTIREAKRTAKESYKPTAEEQKLIEVAKGMTVSDFTSPEGLESLAKNYPALFDAYTSYIRNATKSKGIENDTWWRAGDSMKIGDVLIANMNKENGLRSQSWSDFQVIHILDYIASTIELATRNSKEQAYSKVPDYVELMGNTGVMINMSLIPTAKFNGTLEYDSVEGIDYKRALALRDKYHATAGTICIGVDNVQIKLLLADTTIDYVIPYHKSGMSAAIRKLMHIPTWSQYEEYQSEKNLSRSDAEKQAKKYGVKLLDASDPNYQKGTSFSEWFDLKEAQQIAKMENANPSDKAKQKKYGVMYGGYMAMQNAANNYLKLCAERGLSPKFSHEKADFSAEENYWKLLIDRKMVDNVTGEVIEQKTIKPIFNQGEVMRILNDEIARYPGVKADQDYAIRTVTEKMLSGEIKGGMSAKAIAEVMKKPVDNVTNVNILASGEDMKLSDRDSLGNELSAEQKEFFKDSKVRDANGRLLVVYHGSPSKFTVFKHNKIGEHGNAHGKGFYFTEDEGLASSFYREGGQLLKGYLDIKNPMSEEKLTIKKPALIKLIKAICEAEARRLVEADEYGSIREALPDTFISNYVYTYDMPITEAYKEVANIIHSDCDNDVDIIGELYNSGARGLALEKAYEVLGYDGAIYTHPDGVHEFVSYTSNQFKNADNKTPTSDPDIRYSERETLAEASAKLATISDEEYLKQKEKTPFVLVMENTPQIILGSMEGSKDRKVLIRRDALYLAIRESGVQKGHYHGLGAGVLSELPKYLEQPDVIIATADNDSRRLVLTHIPTKNGQAILSVEFESLKDYEGKNDYFNMVITVFDLHENYLKRLFNKFNAIIKYEKEDLTQVNPQLYKWLRTINAKSSDESISQNPNSVNRKNSDADPKFSDRDSYAPTFYSHMGKVIDGIKLEKMGANGVVSYLKGKGVKDEEIKWSGIEAFLEGKKSVTKAELQEFVAGSQLQITEQVSGGDIDLRYDGSNRAYNLYDSNGNVIDTFTYNEFLDGYVAESDEEIYSNEIELREALRDAYGEVAAPKWAEYKLDGGTNYRELVFQLPDSTYNNRAMRVHWGQDAEGVLAHARIQDMTTSDGKKMLFIEELQSDWHNEGLSKGYTTKEYEDATAVYDKLAEDYANKRRAFNKYVRSGEFRSDPDEVSKKKFDWLRRKMDEAEKRMQDAERDIEALKKKGMGDVPDAPFRSTYHEYVLKRLLRMAAEEGYDSIGWTPSEIQSNRWSDEFAEAYRIEYDQEMPKFLRKYGKKWGAIVGKTKLPSLNPSETYYDVNRQEEYDSFPAWQDMVRDELQAQGADVRKVLFTIEDDQYWIAYDKVSGIEYDRAEIRKTSDSVWSMDIPDSMTESVLYEGQVLYSERVTDQETLDFLENQEYITTYKSFVEIDGKLYSPMAAKVKGNDGKYRLTNPSEVGVWQQAVEYPTNIPKFHKTKGYGYYVLKKDNGKGVTAAYNPYEHSSNLVLNDQFEEAYQRPNLVTVECVIPKSEMTSGYKAKYAKDSTGYLDWKSGSVAGQLKGNKRKVYLSRWLKPVRILSDAEVASMYKDILGTKISVPFNVVTPGLLTELEKVGVKIDYEGSAGYQYRQNRKATEGDTKFSDRDSYTVSNRTLLANALESVAQNDIERNKLAQYKAKIALIEKEQAKLAEIRAKAQELRFTKGRSSAETKQVRDLDFEATQLANRISTYDKQLLNLESTSALKSVLEREKTMLRKRLEQKGKQAIKDQKAKAAKTQRELLTRWQESRTKAIEGRHKTEMRHKIKNVVSDLNKLLLNPTKEQHVPIGLQLPVSEALDAINMDTMNAEERVAYYNDLIAKSSDPDEIEMLTKKRDFFEYRDANFKERITALKNAYAEFKESDDPLIRNAHNEAIEDLIRNTADMVGKTSLKDMSMTQLEAVYNMYKAVLATVRNSNKMFKEGRQATITENSEAVKTEVREVGGHQDRVLKMSKFFKKFGWNMLKPVTAMKVVGSKTFAKLFDNVRAAEDTWAVDVSEAKQFYEEVSSKYGYKKWDFNKRYSFKDSTGTEFSLSLEQIMSLYAYSKRDQADRHLENGGFIFDDAIEVTEKGKLGIPLKYEVNDANPYRLRKEDLLTVTNSLTNEQKGFIDEMQTYLSEVMGAKGNEVSLAMYDIKLYNEKNYFPLKTSRYFREFDPEKSGTPKIKNSGFSKKTVPQAGNPIVLANFMDVWAGHVNDMSMYHAFVLPLEDFMRVYNYSSTAGGYDSVQQYIKNAYGAEANQYIERLMDDLNGGARVDSSADFMNKLISLHKKASVFASASVVIQQPSAIARALAYINPKYFVQATPSALNVKNHKAKWEELKKYAPVAVIKEMGYFDTGVGRSTVEWLKGNQSIKDKMDDVLSKAPAIADELAWTHIWEAVKRETKAKGQFKEGSEEFLKESGRRFTEVVTNTQVYDSVLSRSGYMRSKDTGVKMATAFMAEPTTTLNMMVDGIIQGKRGNKKFLASTVGAVSASIILNSMLVALVYAARDDDEDETYTEKYIGSLTSELFDGFNPLTYIPWVKDFWSLLQGYDVERSDMAVLGDLVDVIDKMFKEDKSGWEKVLDVTGSVSSLFGIPLKNIIRDAKGMYNLGETLLSGTQTTGAGIAESVEDSFKSSVPLWDRLSDSKSNSDRLYEAILSGDQTQIDRIKSRYDDEDDIESAIRKGLRENDSRIKEAARARYDGNISEYTRIAKEIIAEGNFSQDIVVGAINAEINAIKRDEATETETETTEGKKDEATSIYSASDINTAFDKGDNTLALQIIDDLIETKVANGKTEKEAKSSIRSSMTSYWKPLYKEAYNKGNSTEMARIRRILANSGVYGTANEVVKTTQTWLKD